jgi:hypothetical protein
MDTVDSRGVVRKCGQHPYCPKCKTYWPALSHEDAMAQKIPAASQMQVMDEAVRHLNLTRPWTFDRSDIDAQPSPDAIEIPQVVKPAGTP